MDDRKLEFGVGVLVLAAIGVSVILTFIFGAFPVLLRKEYAITAKFPSVAGINVDTPVMKNGVRIGRVKDIQLVNDNLDGGVHLVMMISERFPLKQGEVPRIGPPKLVTGEASVEFVPASMIQRIALFDGKAGAPPDNLIQSAEAALAEQFIPTDGYFVNVDGAVTSDPFSILMKFEAEIKDTLGSIEEAGNSVNSLATNVQRNLETVFGGKDQQLLAIAQQATEAIEQFRSTAAELETILKDTQMRDSLGATLKRLPVLMDDAQQTLQVAQGAIRSFENVGNSFNDTVKSVDRTVRNIEQFTEPLAENSDELVSSLMLSLENLDAALQQVAYFGEQLNQGDGTIRRLIEDDELYFQVRRIAGNIEYVTARARPIVDDVRDATAKVARDPGIIGVRGALNRRPIGAGL